MPRKTKKQAASPNDPKNAQSDPQALMQQFTQLWQEKWQAMLHEKGWPVDVPPPTAATLPFVNPFMMPHMTPSVAPQHDALIARIEKLEARIKKLEAQKKKQTKP